MNDHYFDNEELLDKERIYNYIKLFSFPRLAGTDGEKKAVDLTISTFKKIGFVNEKIHQESFEFSDFYSTILIKLIMTISLTSILILVLIVYIYPIIAFFIIGFMVLLVYLILRGLKHPEKKGFWGEYFGTTYQATNVYVKVPAKSLPPEKAGNIIVSAHLDSKSQSYKTALRILIYRMWLFSGLFLAIFYFTLLFYNLGVISLEPIYIRLFTIDILLLDLFIWPLTGLICFSNIFLMFLNTHNKSYGALDNASGMAVIFELASIFKKKGSLNHFNLWFCQFSAEELGTMGSRIFVDHHEHEFIKGRVFQLNIDMLSALGRKNNRVEYLKSYGLLPRKKISPLLSDYLEKAAKAEGLKIHGFHVTTGAHLDSVPFHLRGYDAIDLTTRGAAFYSHTIKDTPDKVDSQVLLNGCIMIRKVIELLDIDYSILCEKKNSL